MDRGFMEHYFDVIMEVVPDETKKGVSVDAQLKFLCDDLFGEQKYIGTFIWKSRQNKDNRNITGCSRFLH